MSGFPPPSTAPLLSRMSQQLMAMRAGLASGLVLGLGFATGSLGIPITGALGDVIGIQKSLCVLTVSPQIQASKTKFVLA